MSHPDLEAIVALDARLLAAHTEAAGDVFDVATHRERVAASLARSVVLVVRREGRHVAHAYFWRKDADTWFVGGFSIDPAHRNASVLAELARGVSRAMRERGIAALESHVYKSNAASLRFHRRLGFLPIAENGKGVAFRVDRERLAGTPMARRGLD